MGIWRRKVSLEFWLLMLGGYLLGSVPVAYLAARLGRGIDIRKYGSGNVGFTNLWRVTSKKIALPVVIFDAAKGMLPVWLAQLIGLGFAQQGLVGLAAIVGHNWPMFLRFSGGRGILTTVGVALMLMPKLAVILLAIALLFNIWHALPLGTILVIAFFPVFGYFSGLPVVTWLVGQAFGADERLSATLSLFLIFLVMVVRRLSAPRSNLTASVSRGELLFNRLFFDRDIRDRKVWLNRRPEDDGKSRG
jgi:glycerol-3-phosphate acyltransferase PlsY